MVFAGQILTGWSVFNADQLEHRDAAVTLSEYVGTPHFWEATTENWESEFLQMFAFVVLTVFLRQKGSPESDEPTEKPVAESQESTGEE